MTKAKWIAIPVLAAAFALGGVAQAGSIKAADNTAPLGFLGQEGRRRERACEGTRQRPRHVKHANKHIGAATMRTRRGANSPYFCPPGQAKKPGLGSAHRC